MIRFDTNKKSKHEIEHEKQLRALAPECMVLLKTNRAFPLKKPQTIALYGSGARNTIKGGTGSGDVNVREFMGIEQALEKEGFVISTKSWLDAYDNIRKEAYERFVNQIKEEAAKKQIPAFFAGMGAVMPEPEYNLQLDGEGEVAVYVLSRVSGEGGDRRDVPGDYRLTETEKRDILALNSAYPKFMLVLNVGGPVDLSDVMEVENILLLSQLGMATGAAFVDTLLGRCNPSGKLSSTWAPISDFAQIKEFACQDDTNYTEGIYVGYRYFDTEQVTPLFPFGYGKSYTQFAVECQKFEASEDNIEIAMEVKNTGDYAGKEVVQIYYSAQDSRIERPYQELVAFQKTKLLAPGEAQTLSFTIKTNEMECFDEETGNWVLPAGNYCLRAGTDSRNTLICGQINVPEQKVREKITTRQSDELEGLDEQLEKYSKEELVSMCVGMYKEAAGMESVIGSSASTVAGAAGETAEILAKENFGSIIMADGPAGVRISTEYRMTDDGAIGKGMGSIGMYLDFFEDDMKQVLVQKLNEADAQFTEENTYYQYCSAIPIGTALAQSWNVDALKQCGDMVAKEMKLFGVHLWLAPALNIHRSPLCGRNFEYYSEDPYLSGKMAAAMTLGVQAHPGCGVTIKHYTCNNQETNRFHTNSIVDERTLHEIYLKGFEIAVKESQPCAVMTSYNLLNGEHTCNSKKLITDILRNEWGFEGVVVTDWLVTGGGFFHNTKYPSASAPGCIYAGNDLIMPGSRQDEDDILKALEEGDETYPITLDDVKGCVKRIIGFMRKLLAE